MSQNFMVKAQLRTDKGKGASRRLRHQGKIPGIVYGADQEPTMISMIHDDILHAIEDESFFSHILSLDIEGKKEDVIIKDLQRHPARVQVMHVDFQRIDKNKLLHVHVPLHFVNEEKCVGVKMGGLVTHLMTEIEITCLPQYLPEYIEVDILSLGVNESIHLSDIPMPQGVKNVALEQGADHDLPVCSISLPRGEKVAGEEDSSDTETS